MTQAQPNSNINSPVRSPLVSRKEAAAYLGVAAQTLAQWACSGRYSLPIIKIGRSVKYRRSDLDAFISSRTHESGASASKGWLQ